MCVVSMVMDHKLDEWERRYPFQLPYAPPPSIPLPAVPAPMPTPQELDEFRRLLERAREYDRRNREPDCEAEDKRRKLLDLARELGVEDAVREALEPIRE